MMFVREHEIDSTRTWQTVGMHDGAQVLAPHWAGDKLILPCIEDDSRDEVGETVWIVRADQGLDEAFEKAEFAYIGSAVRTGILGVPEAVYVFVELAPERPVRRVTHPDLLK